jgi:hypothetical protein
VAGASLRCGARFQRAYSLEYKDSLTGGSRYLLRGQGGDFQAFEHVPVLGSISEVHSCTNFINKSRFFVIED